MDEKLKRITFSKSLRGYACEEVDTYLRYVVDKYEQRSRECTELRRQMALIAAKMNEYTEGLHKEAEAESAQKKSVQEMCDNMIDEAKRQAAHILADAESEAEVIRRRAEDSAQTIAANAAREGARVVNDAARSVAARSNAADRLVEEIDSFREEVFAMYARHIAELDRLAEHTNAFYDRKTAVAEEAMADAQEDEDFDADAEMDTAPAAAMETDADPAEDAPIRIDWQSRRVTQKQDIVIDIAEADEAEEAEEMEDAYVDSIDNGENDADDLDALFRSLAGKHMLTQESEADVALDTYEDPQADVDEEPYEDPEEETEPYEELYEEPDADAEETEDEDEDDTDWLLHSLKEQYTAKPAPTDQPPVQERPRTEKAPESLETLLSSDTATDPVQDITLTGEFDRIYNREQTEKYMAEVEKQPLHVPEKPKNPKKHTRF